MNRILVITTEPLPLPGGLTTGAGLRAWGLAEGLKSRGFSVIIATPLEGEQAHVQATRQFPGNFVRFFKRPQLPDLVEEIKPDVIVMQHWGLVYALPPNLACPLVIDLAGPHLLERQYWGNPDRQRDRDEKLAALRRADFVICGGYYQRRYFYPFLKEAGFGGTETDFPVIPFSVSPELIEGSPPVESELTVIYGGAFLAWQNPERPIRWLLDEMDLAGKGRLLFYGGTHPSLDASGGRFVELYQFLRQHPRVDMRGWKPFEELRQEYAHNGHVALDLMERNPERELAYTTRTMVYLQCGLPVIYNNYSEISELITQGNCGWCLDPEHESGFRKLARNLLADPQSALARRDDARKAALAQSWDKTIGPLADYCNNPVRRIKATAQPAAPLPTSSLRHDVESPYISTIRRNFFPHPGRYLGILVYFPVWVVCRYLCFSLKVTRSSRAHNK